MSQAIERWFQHYIRLVYERYSNSAFPSSVTNAFTTRSLGVLKFQRQHAQWLWETLDEQLTPLLKHATAVSQIVHAYAFPTLDKRLEVRLCKEALLALRLAETPALLPEQLLQAIDSHYDSGHRLSPALIQAFLALFASGNRDIVVRLIDHALNTATIVLPQMVRITPSSRARYCQKSADLLCLPEMRDFLHILLSALFDQDWLKQTDQKTVWNKMWDNGQNAFGEFAKNTIHDHDPKGVYAEYTRPFIDLLRESTTLCETVHLKTYWQLDVFKEKDRDLMSTQDGIVIILPDANSDEPDRTTVSCTPSPRCFCGVLLLTFGVAVIVWLLILTPLIHSVSSETVVN